MSPLFEEHGAMGTSDPEPEPRERLFQEGIRMSVKVKIECQKCEDIHEEEFDGVLILGFREKEKDIEYPWLSHDIPIRRALNCFLNYLKDLLDDAAKEGGYNSSEEFVQALIQHGKFSIT